MNEAWSRDGYLYIVGRKRDLVIRRRFLFYNTSSA